MTRLVCLHGFCGTGATFDGLRPHVPAGVVIETPALLGHGAAASGVATYEDEVDRLAHAIPPGEPPVLVGYSFGGRLAMGLVARHPGRWRAAVVVGAHPGLPDPDERARRRADDARWVDLLQAGDLDAFVAAWEAQPIFASQAALDPAVRAAQRAERARHDPRALARAMEVLGLGAMPCWETGLVAARVPIAFLAGGRDAKYVALGQALAARVPRLRCEVVPGLGHNVVLEAPAVVAAAALRMAAA